MYNARTIADFFDTYGEKEWERLELTPRDQVSFHIHKHYLEKFIKAGDSVLEAGAGAGRFTIELAKLGAKITVGDISKVQLELNEKYVKQSEMEKHVEARVELDITDLAQFKNNHFEAVVCYGGAVSYVLDKADKALAELLRVTKPGGYVLLSVMSLLGTTRSVFEMITTLDSYPDVMNHVNQLGMLDGTIAHAPMKMYRYRELKALLSKFSCKTVAASAANYLSPGRDEFLQVHLQTEKLKEMFLAWELDYCAEQGAIDGGTHIIVVVQKDVP
jgi:ubiquinone/menaquinone biosynthesis C-methylase UbiE